MRVLVTGGGGFIGSHVVDRLLDRRRSRRGSSTSASRPTTRPPRSRPSPAASPTPPTSTSRCATATPSSTSPPSPTSATSTPTRALAEEINTRGTRNVLEAACRAEVGRVVYGSTTWVYSDCAEQEVDEETPIPAPRHLYTATKLAGENYCAGYAELFDLESTVLRFGIPYGPRARAAGVVAKFTDLALEGKALTIAGDGSQSRSFVYVEDLAAGIVAGLRPEAAGRTYNLSGDEVVTILEIAERVQENTEGCEIVHTPPRPGDFPGKVISSRRALDELGWRAETSFAEGVRRYVEWVRCSIRPPDPVPGKRPSLNGNEHTAGVLSGADRFAESPPKALILTADIGEGHDLPARMIKADIEEASPDAEVEIANGLEAMGLLCRSVARGGSWISFRWMPWLFDAQYWLITKFGPTRWLFHHLTYWLGARGLLRLIAGHEPDVIVSTYPGVTAVLGMLRENRRLTIPVQSAITDLAGLRYWAHPGVDLHFVTHPESIEEVERLVGPGSVEWMRPPISPEFLMPRTRGDARAALGIPAHARLVLVSGGGWGIGDLEGAIESGPIRRGHARRLHHRPQRVGARAARAAVRRQRAGEDPRVHRADERLDGGRRRDGPLDRRADRARGPHPRLPGRLLRLLRRPPARQQRRLRAFRPRRGRPLRHELESILRHLTRERRSPTPRSPRCRRSPAGSSRRGRGSGSSRSGGCAPSAPRPRWR